jgi:ATP-binding cassette, subfamily C, bacteriocin exporter
MRLHKLKRVVTRQQDESDCGVACLSTIVNFYSGYVPLETLRSLSGTGKYGTTLLGLLQAADKIGFSAEGLEAENIDEIKELQGPAILHVTLPGNLLHYIVYFGFKDDNNIIIADPAKGIVIYSKDELDRIWQSKGLLQLNPNEQFVKVKDLSKSKWLWLKAIIAKDFNVLLLSFFFGLITAILGISTAIFSQKLIDQILPSKNIKELTISLILITIILLIRAGLGYLRGILLIRQGTDFNTRMITSFYSSLIHLPKSFFDSRKTGDLIARMNDTHRIQGVISGLISNTLIEILVVIISLIGIFLYSTVIACSVMLFVVLFTLLVFSFRKKIITSQREVMSSYALNESNYIDTIQGIQAIKSNNRETFFLKITKLLYEFYQNKVISLGHLKLKFGLWAALVGALLTIITFALASIKVFQNQLLIGEMVAILSLISITVPAIGGIAGYILQFQEAKVAFDRMYDFTSLKPEYNQDSNKAVVVPTLSQLEVSNVSFRFPGRKQLFKDISIRVNKGEIVAILGESGTGKSTLLQLLQKFYSAESGLISINGINIENIPTQVLREFTAMVPQQIKIFNCTLIDNIGLSDSPEIREGVISFCRSYGFDKFFNSFPEGFSTMLGEEGINISGGQQQLVALARALFRKPQLLLLDEATSAMDRNTENTILNLLKNFKNEMTTIMITHRIKTASHADMIYILEDGTIMCKGNHNELLLTENFYSASYKDIAR